VVALLQRSPVTFAGTGATKQPHQDDYQDAYSFLIFTITFFLKKNDDFMNIAI
jgi:hypothetical protein